MLLFGRLEHKTAKVSPDNAFVKTSVCKHRIVSQTWMAGIQEIFDHSVFRHIKALRPRGAVLKDGSGGLPVPGRTGHLLTIKQERFHDGWGVRKTDKVCKTCLFTFPSVQSASLLRLLTFEFEAESQCCGRAASKRVRTGLRSFRPCCGSPRGSRKLQTRNPKP